MSEATSIPNYSPTSLLRAADIYSTPERRGVLPIGKTTFYRWLAQGALGDGQRVAGTVMWPYSAIQRLGQQVPGEASAQ